MARAVRLLVFRGPGETEALQAAFIGRKWSVLVNCSEEATAQAWPTLETVWRKRHVDTFVLDPFSDVAEDAGIREPSPSGDDWRAAFSSDERRPGRRSLVLQAGQISIGVTPASSQQDAEPTGTQRVLVLDASWTHISRFPDREEVREELVRAFDGSGQIHFITNLQWDADLFTHVAAELGESNRANVALIKGLGDRGLVQARQLLPRIQESDTVLIGLVPGRDERGAFQRLRSDFAERTSHVRAYPAYPLSSGPGASREEALATVGLWLPTHVLIAGGPISEQFLLARHLEESTGGATAMVAVAGGEYRLPSLDLARHYDASRPSHGDAKLRQLASRSGLVIATPGSDESTTLSGVGLPDTANGILPKIRINRSGKTPEQIVHEVEAAFSSRGMPIPAVRYLR